MKKLMKSVLACFLAFAMIITVMPVSSYAATRKAVVVTNQKQLEKALKSGAQNITIKTNKSIKIIIPALKKLGKVSISINAKNATITNKANLKSIDIKDAKVFVESGKNNNIKVMDSKLLLTVATASKGADVQVAKKDAKINVVAKGNIASIIVVKKAFVDLNVKGTITTAKVDEKAADTKLNINTSGKVENVQIEAKTDIAVSGSTKNPVKVTVNAKDTTIKAETTVYTILNADTKLDLSKGAEGSSVTIGKNVKTEVVNNTAETVIVKDSTGKETGVEAGKTEVKTDEGKTDDQKTDDNSGTVTSVSTPDTTPTPSESEETIDSLYVEGSKVLSVYINGIGEVPADYDKNNIEIKSKAGNSVKVASIKKDDDNGYYIYLESDMQDGNYSLTMHLNGVKYSKNFSFDSTFLNKITNKLQKMVEASQKSDIVASVTALEDGKAVLCEDALLNFLEKDIKREADEDYYVGLLNSEKKAENKLSASMSIAIRTLNNSTRYYCETFSDVTFICTGEVYEIAQPNIQFTLKNSVVVKWMKDYEFACVKAGTTIDQIQEEQWTSDADRCDNIEIENLTTGTKYWLYARYDGSSAIYTYKEFIAEGPETICFAEPNGETDLKVGEITAGSQIKVPIMVNTGIYGNYDERNVEPDCQLTSNDAELASFLNRWSLGAWNEELNCPFLSFSVPKGLKTGDYTVNVAYRYEYYKEDGENKDGSVEEVASEPVNFTITFHCNAVENPEVTTPTVLYTFQQSIVVKAQKGMQYACAEEGTVADEWKSCSDDFGNIEFDELKPNTKYIVYAQLADDRGNYKAERVKTASDLVNPVVMVKSDGDKTINAGTVKAGETLHIPIKDLKTECYGFIDEANLWDHISSDLSDKYNLQENIVFINEHADEENWENYYCLEISVPSNMESGTYTSDCVYTYECFIEEGEHASDDAVSKTEPITYNVTFTVIK